jgi:acetylornithine deacetylase/succinyl-diaminopimelate desuccinylase-like protein
MEIKQYIKENEERFLSELFSLIRIPSISALPQHKDDMLACAERWKQLLLEAGADEAMVMPSQGNPLVFAQKHISDDAPTVLIYAHYDVMPAEPLELWKSQPFEPEAFPGIRLIRLTKAQVARLAACQEGASAPPDDSLGTQAMAWQRVTSRRRGGLGI